MSTIPLSILYAVIIVVTIYVAQTVYTLQSSVAPVVNLPKIKISTIENEYKATIEEDQNLQVDQVQASQEENCEEIEGIAHAPSEANNLPGQAPDVVVETKVCRLNSNPNMFYKTQVETNVQCQCLQPFNHQSFQVAKKILNVNIQTMVTLLLFLPMNIFYVYIYFTGVTCNSSPWLIPYLKSAGFLQFGVFSVLYTIIVSKKLKNSEI